MAKWTQEDDKVLLSMRGWSPPASWAEVGVAVERSGDAARSRYKYLKKRVGEPGAEDAFTVPVVDELAMNVERLLSEEDQQDPIHWKNLISIAGDTQAAMEKLTPAKDIQNITLPGDPYPIVVYSGDWHLGHKATDYVRWLYEISMLLRSPNTYIIDLGDDRQNSRSTRHLAWVLSQVLPVELQAQVIVSFTQEMMRKGKLLAKIGGTHDLWFDEGVAGYSLLKWLYQQSESLPYFENEGLLNITVEFDEEHSRTFPNVLFHKSKYRSFLSTLHSNRRQYQLMFPGKVVAGAHDHIPGAEIYWHYGLMERAGYDVGGWSWMIKVGAFTSSDDQFRDLGSFGHRTEIFCPACVYMPEGICLLPTLRDALAYRAGLPAAMEHENSLIEELDVTPEQRENLKDHLLRRFTI